MGKLAECFCSRKKGNRRSRVGFFTEGWVEFKNKKVAKKVAVCLNNTQVGGKRRYEYYDSLWNIKYLHRFRWVHLNERLAYEKAVHQQRMRTEIAQVKRETNNYIARVEKGKKLEKLEKTIKKAGKTWNDNTGAEYKQHALLEDANDSKPKRDSSLLKSIFST